MDAKSSKIPADTSRQFLRHTLATVAYRGGKALRGAPNTFAEFRASDSTRTPAQILAHIGDLYDWALSQAKGKEKWSDSKPLPWEDEVKRFFAALKALDDYLASDSALAATPEKLFQGAIADSLSHIGQILILRRLASSPVRAENYSRAEIVTGRVGSEQAPPPWEADLN
jgi:hypothetical protein